VLEAPAAIDRRPFFHERGGQRLFFLHFPVEAPHGGAVYFAPFAEEMNRARRMATLLGEALAKSGIETLVFDYAGTGDSEGEFGDAGWAGWREDGAAAIDWLADRTGGPVSAVGLRTGAALALEAAAARPGRVSRLTLWQPTPSGQLFLTQFLRLRLAAAMTGAGPGETTKGLRERLAGGATLEIAGYDLSPGMAAALDAMRLADLPPPDGCPVDWLEVSSSAPPEISPAGRAAIERWRACGARVDAEAVAGPPFWSIQEITTAAALIEATLRRLAGARA
jgi:exosortase A-associated hydrolase 2